MRRYGYFAIFRIITNIMLPMIAAGVLFLRLVEIEGVLLHYVLYMFLLSTLFSVVLYRQFKRIFDSEINHEDFIDTNYAGKLHEYHILSSIYTEESSKLRTEIPEIEVKCRGLYEKRKQLEMEAEKLRQKSINFQDNVLKLFEISGENLAMIDLNGKIYRVNHNYKDLLGYDPTGLKVAELFAAKSFGDKLMIEKLLKSDESIEGVVTLRYQEKEGMAWIKKFAMGETLFLLMCNLVTDTALKSRSTFVQNREIDYINKINLSLTINRGTSEMLVNIATSVKELLNISNIVVAREENGTWSVMREERTGDFQKSLEVLEHYNNEQIQLANYSDGEKVVIAKLYSSSNEKIVMVFSAEEGLSSDDLIIIKMFTSQATIVTQRSKSYEQLKSLFFNTVISLVDVIEAKDKYTEGHSMRVAYYAVELAKRLGKSEEEIEKIEISGVLHDVGKVSIPQEILQKTGKLTEEEFNAIKTHPWNGYKIIENIDFDERIKHGVAYHHVRYDLGGYPADHGLKELPEYAALIAIADAFDAMTSKRSYSNEKTMDQAIEELEKGKGSHFCPYMVDAMVALCRERNIIAEAQQMIPNEKGTFSGMHAKVLAMDEEAWQKVGVYEFRKK